MKKILVIGDSCEDIYVYGSCNRLCPDAPVPILIPKKTVKTGGMAKNVFNNIKSLYPYVDLISNTEHITKTRYVDIKTNQMLVRIDSEQSLVSRIQNLNSINFNEYSIVVISDYCKGFLHNDDIQYICNAHPNVFIDTKKILGPYCENAKIIKINKQEFENNVNSHLDMSFFYESLIVTMGNEGCKHKNKTYPVDSVEIKDMTGAGDTFIAALSVKYLESNDIDLSITFANKCATIIVQQKGVNIIGDFIK